MSMVSVLRRNERIRAVQRKEMINRPLLSVRVDRISVQADLPEEVMEKAQEMRVALTQGLLQERRS